MYRSNTIWRACAVAAITLLLVACGGRDRGAETLLPDKLYERAHQSMRGGDYRNAIRYYEALAARFPFSEQARQAHLDLMYSYYKDRQAESAVDSADQFARENPTHPRVDYTWYIKGLVYFERTPNILERTLRTDLSERPPQDARRSFQAFSTLIERFPNSDYAVDARQRMIYLRNRLAQYEVHVADYYLRRKAYVAALARAKFCVENYDGAPAVRPALEVMIASYDAMGMKDLADQSRAVYQVNFPDGQPASRGKQSWWRFW